MDGDTVRQWRWIRVVLGQWFVQWWCWCAPEQPSQLQPLLPEALCCLRSHLRKVVLRVLLLFAPAKLPV
eukprot:1148054-Pelagomonas_calceolata.AAC.3